MLIKLKRIDYTFKKYEDSSWNIFYKDNKVNKLYFCDGVSYP